MALVTKPVPLTEAATRTTRERAQWLIALGVIVALLYYGRPLFITSIVAVVIAFILDPFVVLLMRLRFPRSLASFVVCTVALALLYVVGLGAYSQFSALYDVMPKYGERIGELVDTVQRKVAGAEEKATRLLVPAEQRQEEQERLRAQQQAAAAAAARPARRGRTAAPAQQPAPIPGAIPEVRIHEERTPIGDFIAARLSSFYMFLLMASFVPFLVYFMLSWRDHLNRSFLQFFSGEDRVVATRSLQGIAEMARAFVTGNFVLGMTLAIISSSMFWSMGVPFPMLVGPLSGFLSLVPYVGLPLAMVPPLFSALTLNAVPLYVLVVVSVGLLHLVALNLFYPKIVGSRVHLNPLVVTFSLMLWGFLWDAPGLLLAIPITAGLKAVCDNVAGLRKLGKFLGD
ncbi:MAG: AI-2E family transporter [Bryobacteraceae bacterium]